MSNTKKNNIYSISLNEFNNKVTRKQRNLSLTEQSEHDKVKRAELVRREYHLEPIQHRRSRQHAVETGVQTIDRGRELS